MKKHLVLIVLLLGMALVLAGCATGLQASSWPGVTADAETAYIAGGSYVYAVNLQTGAQVWSFPEKASAANPFDATPSLSPDGQLIVGGFDKKLYSVNPKTGVANWEFTEARDRWIGGALVTSDMIYAPNADYKLYALNLQGQLQWSFEADQALWGIPVSDGTNVYFGSLGRMVYAVNAKTGAEVWSQKIDGAVLGQAVLSDTTLYVGTYGGTLYALNTADGSTLWSKQVYTGTTSWIWAGPALDNGTLYVGDSEGAFSAYSASTGEQLWSQQLNGAIIGSPLVIGENLVVVTEAGNVYFMDLNGQNVRPVAVSGKLYANPVAAGDLILVAPTEGDAILVALDTNGAVKWSFIPAK